MTSLSVQFADIYGSMYRILHLQLLSADQLLVHNDTKRCIECIAGCSFWHAWQTMRK